MMIKVTRTSIQSGITRTKEFEVTEEQKQAYESGVHIQKAFHNLSEDDREFILTGITKEEWNEAFGDEEDMKGEPIDNNQPPF